MTDLRLLLALEAIAWDSVCDRADLVGDAMTGARARAARGRQAPRGAARRGSDTWSDGRQDSKRAGRAFGIVTPDDRCRRLPDSPATLAILSFSSGEFDARSFRLAASAIAAGWEVVVYSRWYPGLPGTGERDGYQLVRIDADPRQALPLVGGIVRRRRRAAVARAKVVGTRTDLEPSTSPPSVATRATGTSAPRRRFTGNPCTWPVRFSRRKIREVRRMLGRWRTALLMFPLRPLGWARAVEEVADPADVWHGMWAGSLPALVRLQRRHGGRTLYEDSRDVYMLSRSFMHLEWPVRPMLERLERRWARQGRPRS